MKRDTLLYKNIVSHIVCNAYDMTSYGLLDGMIGVCIALYTTSENKQDHPLKTYADHLLSKCLNNINYDTSINFSNGLCGISWGIDYLLYKGYVTGKSMEICENINTLIMQIAPSRLDNTLERGIKGLLHYILAHSIQAECNIKSFNQNFIREVHWVAIELIANSHDKEMKNLCVQFENWYHGQSSVYSMPINCFINIRKEEITIENYSSYPINLSNGLCGLLINT